MRSEFVASLKRVERITLGPATIINTIVKDLSVRADIPEGIRNSVIDYSSQHKIEGFRMKRREVLAALLYIFSKNDPRVNKSIGEIWQEHPATRLRKDAEYP